MHQTLQTIKPDEKGLESLSINEIDPPHRSEVGEVVGLFATDDQT